MSPPTKIRGFPRTTWFISAMIVVPLCSATISKNAANRRNAASAADDIAYPFVSAFVVLPTESSLSVLFLTSSGWLDISAIPPALSVIGPNVSSARMNADDASIETVAIAVP